MRLTYLGIQRFGKLKEKEIFLEDGINVIYGPNESGKTTIHSFIRGMLFGVPRYRGRASRTDPYTRFEPWEHPADYAGCMRFEVGGKEFRIDRNFYKSDVRESLVCETDGEQLSIAHGDLEMLLGGINESIYDNTVSVGQLRSETDEGMVRELQKYMANYESAGSGDVDVQKALERLKKKKKEWESRRQELEKRQNRQREQLEDRIGYVCQEKEELERQLYHIQAERKTIELEKKSRSSVGRRGNKAGSGIGKSRILVVSVLLGVLFILAEFLLLSNGLNHLPVYLYVIGIVLILAIVITGIGSIHRFMEKEDFTKEKQENTDKTVAHLRGREEEVKQQLSEKMTVLQNYLESRDEMQEKSEEMRICDTEIKSLELAMKTLGELSGTMRRRIGRRLQSRTESILSEITEGKYSRITMDEDLKVTLYEWNRPVSLYQLSRGTVEQVYFALRMAVGEVLCEERMPVLLDDVFAMYDEKRLKDTLKWLKHRVGQVLIFTCHRREAQMLSDMGIHINLIELNDKQREEISC